MYNELVTQHFHQPMNVGELNVNSDNVASASVGSKAAGDIIQLHIEFTEKNVIKTAKFKAYGNPFVIAAASLATQWIQGKTFSDVEGLSPQDFSCALQPPEIKKYVTLLITDVIHKVAANATAKQGVLHD